LSLLGLFFSLTGLPPSSGDDLGAEKADLAAAALGAGALGAAVLGEGALAAATLGAGAL
jgi:hypothetical protein